MGEERPVNRVAMEALSLKEKVKWRENLERCLVDFGWGDVRLDSLKGRSNAEMKYMLKNCAWRAVTMMWAKELEEQPKLCVLKELVSGGFEARSVGGRRKKMRRILTKLRGGGYSRAASGGGEMERFEEGGEEVYMQNLTVERWRI